MRPCLWIIVCCAALSACDGKSPPAPPSVDSPAAVETITGREQIAWDQRAPSTTELAAVRYAIYVDNSRSEMTAVSCSPSAADVYTCTATLPSLSAGSHTLELAAFVVDGSILESTRSSPLRVNVVATATASMQPAPNSQWVGSTLATSDGRAFRLELVSDTSEYPTDLAFAPDGRLFVAERSGRIQVIPGSEDAVVSEGMLLGLAVDPEFARTHFIYAVYTSATSGGPAFSLARFREASDTFGDRVVLLDNIRAATSNPSAAVRFGPDHLLYAAFDDGGNPASADDLSSAQGKVLRLNVDGSTPADQQGTTPLYAYGFRSPRGLAWQPESQTLWVGDRNSLLSAVVPSVRFGARRQRGVIRQRFVLPERTPPAAMTFFRGDLYIASDAGQHLLRVRFDPHDPGVIVGTERLLDDQLGPIRVVAAGPDEAIYIGTEHHIAKLIPLRPPR
jgi:glucose/arabinose dehydrogenase